MKDSPSMTGTNVRVLEGTVVDAVVVAELTVVEATVVKPLDT